MSIQQQPSRRAGRPNPAGSEHEEPASLAAIEKQISDLQREVYRIEHVGLPLQTRTARAIDKLQQAEAHFRKYGFDPVGPTAGEKAYYFRESVIGALMAVGNEAIIANEQKRIAAAFAAEGNEDVARLSPAERSQRVLELFDRLKRLRARRELAWRKLEAAGQPVERTDADPEAFLRVTDDLVAIASGKEATHERRSPTIRH